MVKAIKEKEKEKEKEYSLCRLVAGYAWEWKSKRNPEAMDIEIDGLSFKWNSTDRNWVNSPTTNSKFTDKFPGDYYFSNFQDN